MIKELGCELYNRAMADRLLASSSDYVSGSDRRSFTARGEIPISSLGNHPRDPAAYQRTGGEPAICRRAVLDGESRVAAERDVTGDARRRSIDAEYAVAS
jgi:hypothetical protein